MSAYNRAGPRKLHLWPGWALWPGPGELRHDMKITAP